MNVLKTLFSSLLLLVVACQFSSAEAATNTPLPIYQNVISDISLGYEGALLGGTIKINDGAILHIKDYKNRDDNIMKTWHKGDIVAFDVESVDESLILSIKRLTGCKDEAVEPYVIFDVVDSPNKGLNIVEIQNNGEFVRLNDNTVWEFGFFNRFKTKKWSVGERVIVQGDGSKNNYQFINLDVPASKIAASATGSFVVY